jgi:hypothetical protein
LLAAGLAAISAAAIVAAPTLRVVPDELTTREVRLSSSQTVTPEFRALAAAAQQQLAAQNAATNAVDYAYSVLTYWTDYGVELADYALQFVPMGYLISSQINIIYPQVIGVTDSIVYDLIDPVLEDPLDPATYLDGLIDVAVSTINALVNVVLAEVDYFFGWLIPPLPPRPFAVSAMSDEELLDDKIVETDGLKPATEPDAEPAEELDTEITEEITEEPVESDTQDQDQDLDLDQDDVDQDVVDQDVVDQDVDLEDLADELSDGGQTPAPEQPGGGSDPDDGVDQDAVGHDAPPAENNVAPGAAEGQGDEGGQPSPERERGEPA